MRGKAVHIIETILFSVILILIVSTLPSLFSYGRPSNIQYYSNADEPDFIGKKLYKLHFHPDNLWRKPLLYFRQLKSGEIFTYMEGKTVRHYLQEIPRYFKTSFFYISLAGVLSLLFGIILSLMIADKKRNPAFYEFLSFMTNFPDFLLILIIQFIFFYINKIIGTTLVRPYTPSASNRAVLLPLIVLCAYPTLYIIRTIGGQLRDINNEPFIRFAHSKGLSGNFIRFYHMGPAAVKFVSGDLHKILAILFSNMFITELMFNNKGITSFLFNNINQYTVTVNTITLMLLMYLCIYGCLQLSLYLIGLIMRRSRP